MGPKPRPKLEDPEKNWKEAALQDPASVKTGKGERVKQSETFLKVNRRDNVAIPRSERSSRGFDFEITNEDRMSRRKDRSRNPTRSLRQSLSFSFEADRERQRRRMYDARVCKAFRGPDNI